MSAPPPEILCLGGGYVATYLCRALRGALRRREVTLTVVDRYNYHTFHGLVPEMLTGQIQPTNVLSAARVLYRGARFVNGDIDAIDRVNRTVTVSRSLDGRPFTLRYDHLVLAIGAEDDLKRYPGIAEHSFRLKHYADCFQLRSHLVAMLELAEIETDPVERERLLTFIVAGGNYAGVEVASELAHYLPNLIRTNFPGLTPDAARVHLVVSGARVLPELDARMPRLVDVAERQLARGPLRIERHTRLAAATAEEAILADGKRLPTRTIISCTGNARSPLLALFPTEGAGGRIVTDATMRVEGTTDTWAAGDCAAVPFPGGGTTPPLAIYAMMAGRQLGRNLRAVIRGRSPRPYRFTGLGDACTLGGGHAVAHLKGFPLTGRFAWLVWRCFMIIYLPSRERKLRVVVDWLLQPWFGRDVLDLKVTPPVGFGSARYEPGQTIVREGDVGRSLFVIRSGEVDVTKATADGPVIIATLRAGDHFGEAAVFRNARRNASVVARTAVELLVLRREAVQALDQSLPGFREKLPIREPNGAAAGKQPADS